MTDATSRDEVVATVKVARQTPTSEEAVAVDAVVVVVGATTALARPPSRAQSRHQWSAAAVVVVVGLVEAARRGHALADRTQVAPPPVHPRHSPRSEFIIFSLGYIRGYIYAYIKLRLIR